MSNKVLVEAPLILRKLKQSQIKEIASKLDLPENNQADLLFMSAILVSTGTNKNGATFLGSELVKARDSIKQKALDIEHEEQAIVGHIAEAMFMDFDGNLIDDEELYKEIAEAEDAEKVIKKLDKMQMDIGIVCVVYKDRFPKIAKEIEAGDWKVSMECYYEDFDVKIGNLIVPKNLLANKTDVSSIVDRDVKLVLAGKSLGTAQVSRVLRGVRFCGVGIVKNPANERSIIMEAARANLQETIDREGLSACLREAATVNLGDESSLFEIPSRIKNEVIQVEASGYFILKIGEQTDLVKDSFTYEYNKAAKAAIALSSSDRDNKYVVVTANSLFVPRNDITLDQSSEAVAYSLDEKGEVVEIHSFGSAVKEKSNLGPKYGPADQPAGICISFEKYVREYPGRPNPGRIVATHWCKLFNKPCPVLGADAQDAACLRNKFSRLVKDESIHGNALTVESFNPKVNPDVTETLSNEDMPKPPTLDEALSSKPEDGEPQGESLLKKAPPAPAFKSMPEKQGIAVTDSDNIPANPLPNKMALIKINPIKDFPVQIASISLEERKKLKAEDFADPEAKKLPLHTPEAIQAAMLMFTAATKTVGYKKKKEMFKAISIAALKAGVDSKDFEKKGKTLGFRLKAGQDFSEEYGLPRLKLFPLDSKEQVISAMSRYSFLKAEITDHERDLLVVNILLAAKKFDIDSTGFRDRVKKG